YFATTFLRVENVVAKTEPQGNISSRRISMQLYQIRGIAIEFAHVLEENFVQEALAVTQDRRRHIMEVVFGMILNTPKHASAEANFRRLRSTNFVAGGHDGLWGQGDDLVAMNGRRVEDRRPAPVHLMRASGSSQ